MTTLATASAADLASAAAAELDRAGVATARVDAEWLLAGLLGVGRFEPFVAGARALGPRVVARYADLVRRRGAGEPLQQLLGWESFRGLRLRVTRDVLVPRPETEMLAEWALDLLARGRGRRLVVDVGTGSGAIACAIASEACDVEVLAVDLVPAAAAVARDNAQALGLADHVRVVVADLLGVVPSGCADLVVSNPPYLPAALLPATPREVRDWEPRVALDGGEDGLAVVRPLIADARRALRPGAPLVLETAGAEQADIVADLLRGAGYADVATRADLTGTVRFVAARSSSGSSAGVAGATGEE